MSVAVSGELKPGLPVKSHIPDCAEIEQFAATLMLVKSYQFCFQDFNKSITITREQFDDGTWQEIMRYLPSRRTKTRPIAPANRDRNRSIPK